MGGTLRPEPTVTACAATFRSGVGGGLRDPEASWGACQEQRCPLTGLQEPYPHALRPLALPPWLSRWSHEEGQAGQWEWHSARKKVGK